MGKMLNAVANPSQAFIDQWETLMPDEAESTRPPLKSLVYLYVLPCIFGILVSTLGVRNLDVPSLLTAIAIYTGLIFNLSFQVFEKSITMRTNPFEPGDSNSIKLVDDLFTNVNYSVLIGLITTAVLVTMAVFDSPTWFPYGAQLGLWLVGTLMAHMFMMAGMVLKRFRALREALKP